MLKSKAGTASSQKAHAFNLKGKARLGYISDYHFNQDPQHFFIAYAPASLSTQAKKSVMASLYYHVGVIKHRAWFKVDNPMIINVCGIDVHLAPCDDFGQRINTNLPIKRHTINDF